MPQEEEPRIGVYICHCGVNIAATVNVEEVAKYAEKLPNVVVAKHYVYVCSSPGQSMIKDDIKEHKLNRVIVASCSPTMHEPTFRRVVADAGLNPYLFEMANIREQCSWVHPKEPEKATQKAKDLIRMAVAKSRLLERLQIKEAGVTLRALIIGAGIAGMRSALDLADRGFEVYLIEKAPSIGGRMAQLNELYPTSEYALDVLKPVMDAVTSHPKIKLFTNSELEALDGFIGNFKAKILVKPRYVTTECNACGKCETVCPIEVLNDFDFGLNKRKAIYLPFVAAVPRTYVIDYENCNKCGKCIEVCERGAIDLKEQPIKMEVDVGTVIVATGHDIYEPPKGEYGYKVYDNVITLHQLERLLDEKGPTKGQLQVSGSTPKSVVFISCVGSRQEPGVYQPIEKDQQLNRYCSRVCCTATFQNALTIKKKYPDARVYYLYRDVRSFGKGHEEYYKKACESGLLLLKYKPESPPVVSRDQKGLVVTVEDVLTNNETIAIPANLVVLNVGMIPRKDASDIQSKLRISKGADGFFQEAHAKLRPIDTPLDGIYLAGTTQGPKDITESTTMGSAAAAKASIPLARGKVEVEPTVSYVNEDLCKGCARCEEVCEYGAIKVEETGPFDRVPMLVAKVTEAQCKGCGSCSVVCPTGAITMRHFTKEQIKAMVAAATGG
jgi:heterodisulfide reductase subunit A